MRKFIFANKLVFWNKNNKNDPGVGQDVYLARSESSLTIFQILSIHKISSCNFLCKLLKAKDVFFDKFKDQEIICKNL